jgi:imidazolonepropionase-like amidohydrolase
MKILFSLFLLSCFISSCHSDRAYYENAICIENINIIDPLDGLTKNQTLIIQNGKIRQISHSMSLNISKKNTIIDGSGKYLIPGLWDAHIHFAYIEALAPSMFDLFLLYGITSVRDTGGDINFVKIWKDKSIQNPTTTPRVMIAGPLLDGYPNVYDGSDPGHPPLSIGLRSLDKVQQKIEELSESGVDLLKAYEMLSPEQFKKVMQIAQQKKLKVTGHVPLSMDVISASNAGLNSMEHLRNLELSCASNADQLLSIRRNMLEAGKNTRGALLRTHIHNAQRAMAIQNFDEEKANQVLDVLAKNNTWQIPTLTLATGREFKHFSQPGWDQSFDLLPAQIAQNWRLAIQEFQESPTLPFWSTQAQWMVDMVGRIHEKDIPIMAGTDTPIFFLTPGLSLHQELFSLVKAGLSPLDALKSATYNPAIYFDMQDELGRIKENYWADLVILDDNPLQDIRNSQKITHVIKQGALIDREKIIKQLGKS